MCCGLRAGPLSMTSTQATGACSSCARRWPRSAAAPNSGVQEQTQVDQANQALAHMMGNQKRARTQVGEMLVAMLVQDIGSTPHAVVIEGDDVTPARTVVLSKPEADPLTGVLYLSNDLQRTMLQVGLQDVPSSPTYRGQQLNALSDSIKSLPPQYQAAAMPFLASLMDVPFKRALVEPLRNAAAQESPEQVEQRIQKAVADALAKAGNDLKARELDMKERKTEAEIRKLMRMRCRWACRLPSRRCRAARRWRRCP